MHIISYSVNITGYSLVIFRGERVEHDLRRKEDCIFWMGPSTFFGSIWARQRVTFGIVPWEHFFGGRCDVADNHSICFSNVIVPCTICSILELTNDKIKNIVYKMQGLTILSKFRKARRWPKQAFIRSLNDGTSLIMSAKIFCSSCLSLYAMLA